jgi:hypothetical protein
MISSADIAERWVERTIETYPAQGIQFASSEPDQFRNPAAYVLKENLKILARELFGAMDKSAIEPAVDALVRLRAVQDFDASEAIRFIFDVRAVIAEVSGSVSPDLESRIDELGFMAFDQYMFCRKQIAALRAKELRSRSQCESS